MESSCVRHTELPHTSRLFSDFLYHFERVAGFYDYAPQRAESYREAAARIEYPLERRAALVEALRAQNGDSAALEALARPGTVAVVTGQQVGLFSGPAYSIYKALTAAALADRLNAAGIPAVPIFWLATEDHDFAEVNHCWVFDPANRPVQLVVSGDNSEHRPVGQIPVDSSPVAGLAEALQGLAFADEVVDIARQAYAAPATFGTAFARLLGHILAGQQLLYFDPLHHSARATAAPLLREALRRGPELHARIVERNRQLEAAGYHAQVHIEEQTSLVFLLENGRRLTLHRNGHEYSADGRRFSTEELIERAAELSPNALLRPVLQDYLLPTVAYVGGPAELAYLAQAQVVYRELLGRMPVAVHRQSFTLLDQRAGRILDRYGLGLPDLFAGEEAVQERMARRLVPPAVDAAFQDAKQKSARVFGELGAALSSFDPTLAAAFDKSRRKIDYQVSKIERKAAREALRRSERAASDGAYLAGLVYPHKHLQERFYSIVPFLARHGLGLIDNLAAGLNLDCPDHRVIVV